MDPDELSPRHSYSLSGHRAAEDAFLAAWNSGRVPHAWLITGPKGIGKATLAYRIARFVLAGPKGGGLFGDLPERLDVSPEDPAVMRIASGGHADFKVVERAFTDESKTKLRSDIAVEDVRGIGAFLSLTPAEGGWRVVIVDAADEMNRSGANAILKILEEPPANSLILLVSHNPGRLLPTIRSRCRRLALRPLDEAVIESLLTARQPELSSDDAKLAARMAEGSAGRAFDLCAEGGLDIYRDMLAVLATLPQLDIPAAHAFSDKVAASETAFRTASETMLWWLAKSVTAQTGDQAGQNDATNLEAPLRRRLLDAAGLERMCEVWEKIAHSFAQADAINLDRKLTVLNAFLALERTCGP